MKIYLQCQLTVCILIRAPALRVPYRNRVVRPSTLCFPHIFSLCLQLQNSYLVHRCIMTKYRSSLCFDINRSKVKVTVTFCKIKRSLCFLLIFSIRLHWQNSFFVHRFIMTKYTSRLRLRSKVKVTVKVTVTFG